MKEKCINSGGFSHLVCLEVGGGQVETLDEGRRRVREGRKGMNKQERCTREMQEGSEGRRDVARRSIMEMQSLQIDRGKPGIGLKN